MNSECIFLYSPICLHGSERKLELVYVVNSGDFLKHSNEEILLSQVSPTDCGWYDGECSSLC